MLNSTLYVTTYSEVTYPLDPFDVTLNPLSAVQIQAKMISQERAKGLFPQGLYRRGNFSCKYVNEVHDFFVIPFCPHFNLGLKLVLPYLSCISIIGETVTGQKYEFQKGKKSGLIIAYLIHLYLFKLNKFSFYFISFVAKRS